MSVATLERWRADALSRGAGDWRGGGQRWTGTARLEAVIATAAMDEAARSAWCREHGLYPPTWMAGSRMPLWVLASRVRPARQRPERTSDG